MPPGQHQENRLAAGPYLAGQVQDHPLFYETRLLWGKTDNDIAQTGLPTASFGSTHFLA